MNNHLFPYEWYLKDGYPKSNNCNVFGTFICGGGSTMAWQVIDKDVIKRKKEHNLAKVKYNNIICSRASSFRDIVGNDLIEGVQYRIVTDIINAESWVVKKQHMKRRF